MRKTLTIVALVLAAGSIAACKPFWQREPAPVPTPTVVEPVQTVETPVVPADPSKTADQTASAETKTTPAVKTETPIPPAK